MNPSMNKTIVVSYDDTTRMIDFCKNADGSTSKEFYDWYLNTENFFTKSGILIVDNITETKEKYVIGFDFNDANHVNFTLFKYTDQKAICSFKFNRHDNIDLSNIRYDLEILSSTDYKKINAVFCPAELQTRIAEVTKEIMKIAENKKFSKNRKDVEIKMRYNQLAKDANAYSCEYIIYSTYAMMYYVSKIEPEEITTNFIKELNSETEKVAGIYKYNGYVDLRNNKTYKPIIKKDPDSPVREYERHIQAWIVRGHYRKTKNGLIWIDEHVKGKGELEKRVYGTVDEKDVNIIPKVFEVERSKVVNKQAEKQIRIESKFTEKTNQISILASFKNVISKFYKWVINT